jgi:hypothetical protein
MLIFEGVLRLQDFNLGTLGIFRNWARILYYPKHYHYFISGTFSRSKFLSNENHKFCKVQMTGKRRYNTKRKPSQQLQASCPPGPCCLFKSTPALGPAAVRPAVVRDVVGAERGSFLAKIHPVDTLAPYGKY